MRIYPLQTKRTINPGYFEVPYIEHRDDGTIRCRGTEDFSDERYRKETKVYGIWTWDGKSYNKGGHRSFEYQTAYRISGKPSALKKVFLEAQRKESGASIPAAVSVRRIL